MPRPHLREICLYDNVCNVSLILVWTCNASVLVWMEDQHCNRTFLRQRCGQESPELMRSHSSTTTTCASPLTHHMFHQKCHHNAAFTFFLRSLVWIVWKSLQKRGWCFAIFVVTFILQLWQIASFYFNFVFCIVFKSTIFDIFLIFSQPSSPHSFFALQ